MDWHTKFNLGDKVFHIYEDSFDEKTGAPHYEVYGETPQAIEGISVQQYYHGSIDTYYTFNSSHGNEWIHESDCASTLEEIKMKCKENNEEPSDVAGNQTE